MITGYALPDFRPVVVRVTSFSEAAASIRSWVKEAINFLYRGHPRPNFIGYDPRTVELRLGRFVVLGAGSTALVALLSASVLYLLPSAGAGVGGGPPGRARGSHGRSCSAAAAPATQSWATPSTASGASIRLVARARFSGARNGPQTSHAGSC